MVIDVNLIKRQGKTEDEFCLQYTPSADLIALPGAEIVGDATVSGTVFLEGRRAVVDGTVRYEISGECSRCLSPARAVVEAAVYAEFSLDAGAEFPIKGGKIDLTVITEEAIMMGAPMAIYCKEDCKGICSGCGVNLNEQVCKCKN